MPDWLIYVIIGACVATACGIAVGIYFFAKRFKAPKYNIPKKYFGRVFNFYTPAEIETDKSKATTYAVNFVLPEKKPFVLICPGGGYGGVSMDWEGTPVAEEVNKLGYSAFVLKYRVGKFARHPNPQDDVAALLKYILDNADELNVRQEDYAIMGFSAGGHLAASFCTKNVGYPKYNLPRPNVAILVYPVITMGANTHLGTKRNLIGENACLTLVDEWSVEKHVDKDYPPVFMWGRDKDACSYKGDIVFKNRLDELGIPNIHEVYSGTQHGESLGIGKPMEGWVKRAINFWKTTFRRSYI